MSLVFCGVAGNGWWGLLIVSCSWKHRSGQDQPMWDDKLPCWCRPFLEVKARQDWKDSLHPPVDMKYLPWHPVEREGDSIKNSADTCKCRLLLRSKHQQSHFHWIVFQCHLFCPLYLVPHFPYPSSIFYSLAYLLQGIPIPLLVIPVFFISIQSCTTLFSSVLKMRTLNLAFYPHWLGWHWVDMGHQLPSIILTTSV